jgi:uncharacterized protein YfaS (alpha-2-macroglobulin family)
MAINSICSGKSCYVWTNNLENGSTISKSKINYYKLPEYNYNSSNEIEYKIDLKEIQNLTDEDGLTKFSINESNLLLLAEKDDDITFNEGIQVCYLPENSIISFVFDDRKLYKPKETVTIKGFIRKVERYDENNSLKILKVDNLKDIVVNYKINDSVKAEYLKSSTKLNEYGSFKFEFIIPDNVNLGNQTIYFDCLGKNFNHSFKIQGLKYIFILKLIYYF